MKIAVFWQRFGPYHLARLRGAAEVGSVHGHGVVGVEVAARDHYAWESAPGAQGFERRTLFPAREYGSLSSGEIRRAVAACLGEMRPEAVAVNGWSAEEARAAIRWCSARDVPVVLMSETKADDARRRWWREWVKRRVVRRCAAALVGGRPHANYAVSLGVPASRVIVGYDAVDNDHFHAGAERARHDAMLLRQSHGLPERYFFVCTRFLARKNLDGLLRAYAVYRRRVGLPWHLVIAGGGDESTALRRLAASLDLDTVKWPGFVQYPALPTYYGLAGAFVHPAVSEPWGLVVNEAAASGLPLLVAAPVGAAYELVEEGANGWLFDPQSVDDMATALKRMSTATDAQRAAMGVRSREIVAGFSPQCFGEALWTAVGAAQGG